MPPELVVFLAFIAIVPPLLVSVVGLLNYLQVRRTQPHQAANTDALTLSSLQGTLADVLASQGAQLKEMDDLRKQLRETTARAEAAEKRADAAEAAVVGLTQQVKDYPDRVIQLEAIISELRAEIARLQGVATSSAVARQMEAETASTLAQNASTAQAVALATPPPVSADTAIHSGDTVTVTTPEKTDEAKK